MASPRVLGYDDLHGYLEAQLEDAYDEVEAADDADANEGDRQFHAGGASAITDLIAHIERELMAARYG